MFYALKFISLTTFIIYCREGFVQFSGYSNLYCLNRNKHFHLVPSLERHKYSKIRLGVVSDLNLMLCERCVCCLYDFRFFHCCMIDVRTSFL